MMILNSTLWSRIGIGLSNNDASKVEPNDNAPLRLGGRHLVNPTR